MTMSRDELCIKIDYQGVDPLTSKTDPYGPVHGPSEKSS